MPILAIHFPFLAAYVTTSSCGLLLLKQSLNRIRAANGVMLAFTPNTFLLTLGFCLYVFSFALWIRILARLPLSLAYPIVVGLTMAASTAGAVFLLGERLSAVKFVGILLVLAGCVALNPENK
jgi:multidrug transporter EmrE-like cation transporter